MKRIMPIFIFALTVLFTAGADAGWVLYDNFDGYADIEEMKASDKWHISAADEAIANFSIEEGKLKIEHLPGYPDDSAWAQLILHTDKFIAIRATILVQSWTGEIRARIGTEYGTLQDNPNHYIWYSCQVGNEWADWLPVPDWEESVSGYMGVYEINTHDWQYDLFFTKLGAGKHPVVGMPYKLTAGFGRGKALYQVDVPNDIGKVSFDIVEKVDDFAVPFRAIGTRAFDNAGTCIVYFDNIYVYTEFLD